MAPDLLDLAFGPTTVTLSELPEAEYLPALQRQKELESQLAKQQVLFQS
jgi:hypothetical protein